MTVDALAGPALDLAAAWVLWRSWRRSALERAAAVTVALTLIVGTALNVWVPFSAPGLYGRYEHPRLALVSMADFTATAAAPAMVVARDRRRWPLFLLAVEFAASTLDLELSNFARITAGMLRTYEALQNLGAAIALAVVHFGPRAGELFARKRPAVGVAGVVGRRA